MAFSKCERVFPKMFTAITENVGNVVQLFVLTENRSIE